MSGEEVESDAVGARVESLVQFGFQRAEIEAFLAEHDGAMSERLMWLEERRATASVLEDRIVAFCQHSSVDASAIEAYKTQLSDPFSVEAVALELERAFHRVAPWEPPMNKSKTAWFGEGQGDVWSMFYKRLAALDVSSHAAIAPLHRLFTSPIHADELVRHLELVETDDSIGSRAFAFAGLCRRGRDGMAAPRSASSPRTLATISREKRAGKAECRPHDSTV